MVDGYGYGQVFHVASLADYWRLLKVTTFHPEAPFATCGSQLASGAFVARQDVARRFCEVPQLALRLCMAFEGAILETAVWQHFFGHLVAAFASDTIVLPLHCD